MRLNLDLELDRKRFLSLVDNFLRKRCRVDCSEVKPKRSNQQNAYLHCILGEFAMRSGYTLSEAKEEYFKKHCNPDLFVVKKIYEHIGEVEILRSSADLTTSEMTLAINRFRDWASVEAGIYLPSPNENKYIEQIEDDLARYKRYL